MEQIFTGELSGVYSAGVLRQDVKKDKTIKRSFLVMKVFLGTKMLFKKILTH